MSDPTADLLDRHHIAHTDPTDIELASIDLGLSIAHQVRGQDVDPTHVDRLTDGYLRGDRFPPLIVRFVDGRLALVGGMHRTHAAVAADLETHAAYVIDVDDHTARLLAVDDNARHGLPLQRSEAIHQAALLVEGGTTVADAARAVGLHRGVVDDELAIRAGQARAVELGCELAWESLARTSTTNRPRKAAIALTSIEDDACFQAAVDVVSGSKVPHATVEALVDRLSKIPDQADRLAEIGDLDDQGGSYVGGSGSYDVHRGDDSATVELTRILIDLQALDVEQAIAGLRGKDSIERTDRRLTDAGKQILALGRALDRRKRGGR